MYPDINWFGKQKDGGYVPCVSSVEETLEDKTVGDARYVTLACFVNSQCSIVCRQLADAVEFQCYNKQVANPARISPNKLTTMVKGNSTYIVYKSATGAADVPITFSAPILCRMGNIGPEGYTVQGANVTQQKCM